MGVHTSLLLLRMSGRRERDALVVYLRSNANVFNIWVCNGLYDLVLLLGSPSATDKLAFVDSVVSQPTILDYQSLELTQTIDLERQRLGRLAAQPELAEKVTL